MEPTPHKTTQALENFSISATKFIGSIPSLILHTIMFIAFFVLIMFGFEVDKILLFLTTIVSLEAIYLSIFIQMSVNRAQSKLEDVSDDIEEIHEDIEEIQEDVEEIHDDIEGIQEDIEEVSDDIEEIQKDVDEMQEDIEEVTADIEEIQEDIEEEFSDDEVETHGSDERFSKIEKLLAEIQEELKNIKK